jgi:hypothetical protein
MRRRMSYARPGNLLTKRPQDEAARIRPTLGGDSHDRAQQGTRARKGLIASVKGKAKEVVGAIVTWQLPQLQLSRAPLHVRHTSARRRSEPATGFQHRPETAASSKLVYCRMITPAHANTADFGTRDERCHGSGRVR